MSKGNSGHFKGTKGANTATASPKNYNTAGSKSVKNVDSVTTLDNQHNLPMKGTPNSVTKNFKDGSLNSERYYDEKGNAYLDIDYTDHGNPTTHPYVPHEHKISFNSEGQPCRKKEEDIKK